MSSFGDENIKTRIQEELDCICWNYYGKDSSDLTDKEKLQFTMRVLEVLQYITGYSSFSDNEENAYPLKD